MEFKQKINVLRPKFRVKEILSEIEKCLNLGWTGMGFKTVEFEKAWNKYTGLKNNIFLSSNTVGLHLALRVFKQIEGWNEGDEIITTPLTFVSTNHSIKYEGLNPVFADVDEYLCLDPSSIEKRITNKTKGVLFVGIGGNPGQLSEVQEICRKRNLKLILDAAHMAGTYVHNSSEDSNDAKLHVGHEADATVFSFQAVKNLPTADSGIISFRDSTYYKLAKKLSWLGIDKDTFERTSREGQYNWKYNVPEIGFKYNGNSIMASMALVQLKYLDQDNDYRNKIAEWYDKLLDGTDSIKIVRNSDYCFKSSRHLYQVRLQSKNSDNRDTLIQELGKKGIFSGVHYIDNTTYPMYKYAYGTCPNSHLFSDQLISLPIHLELDKEMVEKVTIEIKNLI